VFSEYCHSGEVTVVMNNQSAGPGGIYPTSGTINFDYGLDAVIGYKVMYFRVISPNGPLNTNAPGSSTLFMLASNMLGSMKDQGVCGFKYSSTMENNTPSVQSYNSIIAYCVDNALPGQMFNEAAILTNNFVPFAECQYLTSFDWSIIFPLNVGIGPFVGAANVGYDLVIKFYIK
jgi:hypothetical protein